MEKCNGHERVKSLSVVVSEGKKRLSTWRWSADFFLRNVEPHTRPRLECLRETGPILRCDRKVGNPFQTKQGSRPSCPDQVKRSVRKKMGLGLPN